MTGDDLPADAQIVRYVKPSMIQEDGTADGSEFRARKAIFEPGNTGRHEKQ